MVLRLKKHSLMTWNQERKSEATVDEADYVDTDEETEKVSMQRSSCLV